MLWKNITYKKIIWNKKWRKKDKLKILNIHSGTTDDDISKFINEKVIIEEVEIMNKESNELCLHINLLISPIDLHILISSRKTQIWVNSKKHA